MRRSTWFGSMALLAGACATPAPEESPIAAARLPFVDFAGQSGHGFSDCFEDEACLLRGLHTIGVRGGIDHRRGSYAPGDIDDHTIFFAGGLHEPK